MSASQKPMTLEAFLAWEERQPLKYEFDGLHAYAMTGGSAAHARVQGNLFAALKARLRDGPCEAFLSDFKILTRHGVRYPDCFVTCSRIPDKAQSTADAVIVFEVLSPSTSRVDRVEKSQEYRHTPSIQRYVILEQDWPAATVFSRDNNDWVAHLVTGETDLVLPEIGVSIPLMELYEGVELVPSPSAPEA